MMTRRQAIKTAAMGALAYPALSQAQITVKPNTNISGKPAAVTSTPVPTGPFKLPPLPYAYDALEPNIDAQTMRIHHDMHHAGYVNNLNKAVAGHPDLTKKNVEELLRNLFAIPEAIRTTVRNNGGGHYNHSLFWPQLASNPFGRPRGPLSRAITAKWGTFDAFREAFTNAATGLFGSGWVWLVIDPNKEVAIETTPNQDCPLMQGRQPIMGLDVWEHAYYLKYQNRRAEYVNAFYKVLNWDYLGERFQKLMG